MGFIRRARTVTCLHYRGLKMCDERRALEIPFARFPSRNCCRDAITNHPIRVVALLLHRRRHSRTHPTQRIISARSGAPDSRIKSCRRSNVASFPSDLFGFSNVTTSQNHEARFATTGGSNHWTSEEFGEENFPHCLRHRVTLIVMSPLTIRFYISFYTLPSGGFLRGRVVGFTVSGERLRQIFYLRCPIFLRPLIIASYKSSASFIRFVFQLCTPYHKQQCDKLLFRQM